MNNKGAFFDIRNFWKDTANDSYDDELQRFRDKKKKLQEHDFHKYSKFSPVRASVEFLSLIGKDTPITKIFLNSYHSGEITISMLSLLLNKNIISFNEANQTMDNHLKVYKKLDIPLCPIDETITRNDFYRDSLTLANDLIEAINSTPFIEKEPFQVLLLGDSFLSKQIANTAEVSKVTLLCSGEPLHRENIYVIDGKISMFNNSIIGSYNIVVYPMCNVVTDASAINIATANLIEGGIFYTTASAIDITIEEIDKLTSHLVFQGFVILNKYFVHGIFIIKAVKHISLVENIVTH